MSAFDKLKKYINSIPIGEIAYRKDFTHCLNSASLDQYRRRLSLLGYISIGEGNGTYKKLKQIPDDFKTSDLNAAYKNKRFKLKKNARIKKSI